MNLEIHKLNSAFFLPLKNFLKMDNHDTDINDKIGSLMNACFQLFCSIQKKVLSHDQLHQKTFLLDNEKNEISVEPKPLLPLYVGSRNSTEILLKTTFSFL